MKIIAVVMIMTAKKNNPKANYCDVDNAMSKKKTTNEDDTTVLH